MTSRSRRERIGAHAVRVGDGRRIVCQGEPPSLFRALAIMAKILERVERMEIYDGF